MSLERINTILKEASGNSLDVYGTLYEECLKDEAHAPEFLRAILESLESVGTDDGESASISRETEKELKELYQSYLRKQVSDLTKRNDPTEVFYRQLWTSVLKSPAGPKTKEQGAVCLKILNEEIPLLPYYQATGLLRMSDADFSACVQKISPSIQETIHMLNRYFSQKTEKTSQIYRIMQSLSKEESIVYLALLLNLLQENYTRAGYEKARREREEKRDS